MVDGRPSYAGASCTLEGFVEGVEDYPIKCRILRSWYVPLKNALGSTRVQFVRGPQPPSLSWVTRPTQVCKPWRWELEARGFCNKTVLLCAALVKSGDAPRLMLNALRRLSASTDDALSLDRGAFLRKTEGWAGSMKEWLQAASQEPDESHLSRGAASTAQSVGLALVRWVRKPQGKYPESYTLPRHSAAVLSIAISRDGKRIASGSGDNLVKIWNSQTGAEVCNCGKCARWCNDLF